MCVRCVVIKRLYDSCFVAYGIEEDVRQPIKASGTGFLYGRVNRFIDSFVNLLCDLVSPHFPPFHPFLYSFRGNRFASNGLRKFLELMLKNLYEFEVYGQRKREREKRMTKVRIRCIKSHLHKDETRRNK